MTFISPSTAKHIIIVGIDGMGGYYIDKKLAEACNTTCSSTDGSALEALCPTFTKLLKGKLEGFNTVFGTTNARTVFPPISSPAWGSILSGLTPDQTGMMNNDWPIADVCEEDGEPLQPLPVVGSPFNKAIPRLVFDMIPPFGGEGGSNKASADASSSNKHFAAVSWSWLGRKMLSHMPNIHTIQCDGSDERVVTDFVDRFSSGTAQLPKISFLHFDDVDHAGHKGTWGSDEYYSSWTPQDEKLGRVLAAVKDTSAVIIVISDHGGSGKGHGDMKRSHMQIPIIMATTEACPRVELTAAAEEALAKGDTAVHGREAPATVSCIDVVPTLLSLQGVAPDHFLRGNVLAGYAAQQ